MCRVRREDAASCASSAATDAASCAASAVTGSVLDREGALMRNQAT